MKEGHAVALHFAGLYMIENYAVPASTIRDYLTRRPWHSEGPSAEPTLREAERSRGGWPTPPGGAQAVGRGRQLGEPELRREIDVVGTPGGRRSGVRHHPAHDHRFAGHALA